MRPPAPHIGFLVEAWVPVADLTETERKLLEDEKVNERQQQGQEPQRAAEGGGTVETSTATPQREAQERTHDATMQEDAVAAPLSEAAEGRQAPIIPGEVGSVDVLVADDTAMQEYSPPKAAIESEKNLGGPGGEAEGGSGGRAETSDALSKTEGGTGISAGGAAVSEPKAAGAAVGIAPAREGTSSSPATASIQHSTDFISNAEPHAAAAAGASAPGSERSLAEAEPSEEPPAKMQKSW